jgi:hypothetical protein
MAQLWWQMPGPSRFVAQVADSLRGGRNVVLSLPEHLPAGLRPAVRAVLGDEWPWETCPLPAQANAPPLAWLFARFGSKLAAEVLYTLPTLLDSFEQNGQIIWLEGFTPATWPAWREFLGQYQHACRAVPQLRRTVFCCVLEGANATCPPSDDVCLENHAWRGMVDALDAWLFAASVFRPQEPSRLRNRLAIAIVAHLALWDAALIERLAQAKLSELLCPQPLLGEIAQERGWVQETAVEWHLGTQEKFEGVAQVHSALLALGNDTSELGRRIWSAQVSLLLPWAEEQRRNFITHLAGTLRIPFTTSHGKVITRIKDLELGHINAQLSKLSYVDANLRRSVESWLAVRNSLAHLERVPAALLLSGALDDDYSALLDDKAALSLA